MGMWYYWSSFGLRKIAQRDSENLSYDAMTEMEKAKGRLLYYNPLNGDDDNMTFHNDSGFQSLSQAIFMQTMASVTHLPNHWGIPFAGLCSPTALGHQFMLQFQTTMAIELYDR